VPACEGRETNATFLFHPGLCPHLCHALQQGVCKVTCLIPVLVHSTGTRPFTREEWFGYALTCMLESWRDQSDTNDTVQWEILVGANFRIRPSEEIFIFIFSYAPAKCHTPCFLSIATSNNGRKPAGCRTVRHTCKSLPAAQV